VTGELSLTGELWSVEDLSARVQGAGEAGLKRAVLPPLHRTQEPLPNPLDGVEVIHVSSLFEAISRMVIGGWLLVVTPARNGASCLWSSFRCVYRASFLRASRVWGH
jgi:hypothetical protein